MMGASYLGCWRGAGAFALALSLLLVPTGSLQAQKGKGKPMNKPQQGAGNVGGAKPAETIDQATLDQIKGLIVQGYRGQALAEKIRQLVAAQEKNKGGGAKGGPMAGDKGKRNKPDGAGGKQGGAGGKPDGAGGKPDGAGGKPDGVGKKPDGAGGKP